MAYTNSLPYVELGNANSVVATSYELSANPAVSIPDEIAIPREHARPRRRLLPKILASAAVLGAALTIPEPSPFHEKASLASELAISDTGSFLLGANTTQEGNSVSQDYDYLQSNFAVGNNGLYKGSQLGWYASVWPQSREIDTLKLMSLVPGHSNISNSYQQALSAANNHYWDGADYDPGLRAFHNSATPPLIDDNLWMGLINAREFKESKDPAALQKAETIFRLAVSQWDQRQGGIYWQDQLATANDHSRAIVSNAPAVMLGVELYQKTGRQYYLDWAEKIFGWTQNTLFDKSSGLYNDHINADGSIDTTKWTYVQGVMAGAMAALSQVRPEQYPLQNAVNLVKQAMNYYDTYDAYDEPEFAEICFENFIAVAGMYQNPEFTQRVYGELAKAAAHTPKSPKILIEAAGKAGLIALQKIPLKEWNDIF